MENLALAGGFDSFKEISREQYFAENGTGEVFLETLMRYGNTFQADQAQAMNSLFGADMVEIAKPDIPVSEHWNEIELLNKERELIGIYLSAHPLDEYAIILKHVCNTNALSLEDKESLVGKDITFGGMITTVRKGITRNGNPYGIAKLEDFTGSIELPLFGEDWVKFQGYMDEGMFLYISAKCQPRQWRPEEIEIKINTIQLLPDVKDELIEKLTLYIPLNKLDSTLVADLAALIKGEKGNTELYFTITDREEKSKVDLFARPYKINVGKDLMNYLNEHEEIAVQIN